MEKNEIIQTLKEEIVERLDLFVEPDEIGDGDQLFGYDEEGHGLGLDSIDVLEIIVVLRQKFGLEVKADEDREIFHSLNTLSDYIETNMKQL